MGPLGGGPKLKLYELAVVIEAFAVFSLGCQSAEPVDPGPDPDPNERIATFTGAGDGASWSDLANWDRSPIGADAIVVTGAQVNVDVDLNIDVEMKLRVTSSDLVISVNSLLLNRGEVVLDAGSITAKQGGWFQNEGSIEGTGILAIECDDGGSAAGSVGEGVTLNVGECLEPCFDIDFNELAAGTIVTDQYGADFVVSAVNNDPLHANNVVVFDSANPTGDDDDLATPGTGIGNNSALGSLLIISETDIDGDGDGLIDDPDDETAGGTITFDFTCAYVVENLLMIDVEEFGATKVELFNGGTSVYVANGTQLDDNSVQALDFTNAPPADQVVVTLLGSGAIDDLRICPTHE